MIAGNIAISGANIQPTDFKFASRHWTDLVQERFVQTTLRSTGCTWEQPRYVSTRFINQSRIICSLDYQSESSYWSYHLAFQREDYQEFSDSKEIPLLCCKYASKPCLIETKYPWCWKYLPARNTLANLFPHHHPALCTAMRDFATNPKIQIMQDIATTELDLVSH